MLHEAHTAESTRTQRRKNMEIVQVENVLLFTISSILNLFRRLVIVHFMIKIIVRE